MLSKQLSYGAALPAQGRGRHLAAVVLHGASLLLGQLARHLLPLEQGQRGEPVLEFYAEAGAPEGALYLDGKLVGHLSGVNRL